MKVKSTREDERNGREPRSPSEQRNLRRPTFVPLGEVDRAILGELTADARIRTAELGRRVGLSAPAIAERLRRLEESGVVSYRAEVDPRALGLSLIHI